MSHALSQEDLLRQENQRYHAFVNLALFLAVLTGIEIVIIFLPWAFWLIMTILVVLSTVKFVCVILWFMHLIYDKILLFWVFLAGLVLAAGTMIALLALFDSDRVDMDKLIGASTSAHVENIA